jgi:hypothetical protein
MDVDKDKRINVNGPVSIHHRAAIRFILERPPRSIRSSLEKEFAPRLVAIPSMTRQVEELASSSEGQVTSLYATYHLYTTSSS